MGGRVGERAGAASNDVKRRKTAQAYCALPLTLFVPRQNR
jgi:hypothetical protein